MTMKTMLALGAAMLSATAAYADPVYPGTSWGSLPGENTGANAAIGITGTVARSGNGSVEMTGDRTRFTNGNYYDKSGSGLYSTGAVNGLTFDWRVAGDSANPYNADYTPALRMHIYDPTTGKRSELIWEGVYNNVYGNEMKDTWYSTTTGDNFYQYVTGNGVTLNNGSQVNQTLAQWLGTYSSTAMVTALSVGDGSGASGSYHAFADNVSLFFTNGTSQTFNFELAPTAAAVPEPASWAMMIVGIGAAGAMVRRRRVQLRTARA